VEGAQPAGSNDWVNGFDHSGWASLLPYFIYAYKNGVNITDVPVTNDTVVFYYRTHSINAVASQDPLPPPTGSTWPEDNVQVIAFLTEPGTIVVNSGSDSQSFSAVAGFNEFALEGFSEGQQQVELVRGGQAVACGTGSVPIDNSIELYNFNAAVVQVTPGTC
jgi:glucan endo-1,3-alpha-glucosidase